MRPLVFWAGKYWWGSAPPPDGRMALETVNPWGDHSGGPLAPVSDIRYIGGEEAARQLAAIEYIERQWGESQA